MHVLTGLRAGARCGSAHSGAPWTPPTARGMLKRVRRAGGAAGSRAVLAHTCLSSGAGEQTKDQLLAARLLCYSSLGPLTKRAALAGAQP